VVAVSSPRCFGLLQLLSIVVNLERSSSDVFQNTSNIPTSHPLGCEVVPELSICGHIAPPSFKRSTI
jgi:hypothetical protein